MFDRDSRWDTQIDQSYKLTQMSDYRPILDLNPQTKSKNTPNLIIINQIDDEVLPKENKENEMINGEQKQEMLKQNVFSPKP